MLSPEWIKLKWICIYCIVNWWFNYINCVKENNDLNYNFYRPTKYGTIGPSFCNKSLIFDPTFIYGIKDKLNEYWTDILIKPDNTTEAILPNVTHKKESIWFHEWTKHGTCAITLPALNSEFKYFNQGVEWSEKYNMKYILEKSGIKVNSTSNVNDYWKAVKSVLKTNVWIECFYKAVSISLLKILIT